jgi:hypothetical protein
LKSMMSAVRVTAPNSFALLAESLKLSATRRAPSGRGLKVIQDDVAHLLPPERKPVD